VIQAKTPPRNPARFIIIGRFAGGKLIEDWVELDRLGLFQQLGCIPTGS
jgi:hypothetical protein